MEKKYISVDIEASGPTPGKYSMLALGACLVEDTAVNFYRQLKPISMNYSVDSMKVAVRGLSDPNTRLMRTCVDAYNPDKEGFAPAEVLESLLEIGTAPDVAMKDFADWIHWNTQGFRPIEVAYPIKFDGMFTAWYFDNFNDGKNPFGYGGLDLGSLVQGVTMNWDASPKDTDVADSRKTPHNALEDAIYQAKLFNRALSLMRPV